LATSREALGIDGELLRPLGSLPVPDEDRLPADLTEVASVRLFADRAQAVRPDFALDPVSGPVVADICRQLDGVPLAIELAAARVNSLTVNEIAQRLDQRFRLLTGGRRTALERHQTLRGAVDWSYELLEEAETRVFNRLAVFAGGFSLDAAEAVVIGDGVEAHDVLDVLSRLVARSMVVAEDSEAVTRYRLLETMRQYARERLDSVAEGDVVRRRHAEHYLSVAEAAEVGVKGRDEARWVRIIDREFANFAAALDWSVGTGDADLALRLAVALGARPEPNAGSVVGRVVSMPEARHHPLRPHAMAFSGIPALAMTGNIVLATELLRAMDAAFEEAGLELTSLAHFVHSALASVSGNMAEATAHGTAAIELALQAGDRYAAGVNSAMLALFLATAGGSDRAVQLAEQAHTFGAELESPTLLALSETAVGYALSTVDPDAAIPHLETGLSLLRARRDQMMMRYTGERCLARLHAARGELRRALEIYATVLNLSMGSGSAMQVRLTCESLGVDLTAAGFHDAGATILGAIEADTDAYPGNPMVKRGAAIATLQRTMGEKNFDECVTRGRAINADELGPFAHAMLTHIIAELDAS
jgi:hypothetical protein